MGIHGEGEQSAIMLLEQLKNDEDLSNTPGLHHAERDIANSPVVFKKIDQNSFPLELSAFNSLYIQGCRYLLSNIAPSQIFQIALN